MFLKIFTLEFNTSEKNFDDTVVNSFLKNKELVSVKDYLIENSGKPFLVVLVTYKIPEGSASIEVEKIETQSTPSTKDEWRQLITKENEPLFNRLKNWRLEESKKQSLSAFIIFTNKQLAEIVTLRPKTLTTLSQIEGIGPLKIQKYGERILSLLEESSIALEKVSEIPT